LFYLNIVLIWCIFILGASGSWASGLFPNKRAKILYMNACAECHGRKGHGAEEGPGLRNNDYIKKSSPKKIIALIKKGIQNTNTRYFDKYIEGMPASENLTEEETKTLAGLLKKWNP